MDARDGLRTWGLALFLTGLWLALTVIAPARSGWCARLSRSEVVVQSVKNVRPEEYTVRGKVAPLPPEAAPKSSPQAATPAEPPAPAAPPTTASAQPVAQPPAPAGNTSVAPAPAPAAQVKPAVPPAAKPASPPAAKPAATPAETPGRAAAIRIERGGDFPRLSLDLGGPVTYKLQRMERPPRLVLDVPGRFRLTTRPAIEAGPGGLAQVRAWAHEDRLRVVLDLSDEKLKARITPTDTGLTLQLVQPAAK